MRRTLLATVAQADEMHVVWFDQPMAKLRKPTRHNPMARALAQPLYRPRVLRDRKRVLRAGYTKHRKLED